LAFFSSADMVGLADLVELAVAAFASGIGANSARAKPSESSDFIMSSSLSCPDQ
jgi:hypothetical protein